MASDALQPWGIVYLGNSLASDQPYDITVHLDLPRSPTNLHAGNFMLDMALLSPAIGEGEYEVFAASKYPYKAMPVEAWLISQNVWQDCHGIHWAGDAMRKR